MSTNLRSPHCRFSPQPPCKKFLKTGKCQPAVEPNHCSSKEKKRKDHTKKRKIYIYSGWNVSICESYCGEALHRQRNSSSLTPRPTVRGTRAHRSWITQLRAPPHLLPRSLPEGASEVGQRGSGVQRPSWHTSGQKSTSQIHRQVFGALRGPAQEGQQGWSTPLAAQGPTNVPEKPWRLGQVTQVA